MARIRPARGLAADAGKLVADRANRSARKDARGDACIVAYVEPTDHWVYDKTTGAAMHGEREP